LHVPSDAGIERRGSIAPVGMLKAIGRRARGPWLRELCGQAEMPEDAFHRAGVFDEGEEPQSGATARTLEHVESKRPSHQIGPEIRTGST
jgi:hypothetical protein